MVCRRGKPLPIDLLPFAAPLALLMSAVVSFLNPGRRPRMLPRLAEASALVTLLVAVVAEASVSVTEA